MATRRRKGAALNGSVVSARNGTGSCHVGRHTRFRPGRGQYSRVFDVDTTTRANRTQE